MEMGRSYLVRSLHNAFCMLFKLAHDCSESGMFAGNNVMSCSALVRKLVFFTRE